MLSTRKDSWMMTREDMQILLHVAEWTLNHRHVRHHSPDVHRWYGNRYETDAPSRSSCVRLRFRRCGGAFRRGNERSYSYLAHLLGVAAFVSASAGVVVPFVVGTAFSYALGYSL